MKSNRTTVRIWDIKEKKCIATFEESLSKICFIELTLDNNYLLTGNSDDILTVWSLKIMKTKSALKCFTNIIISAAVTNNEKYVIAEYKDNYVIVLTMCNKEKNICGDEKNPNNQKKLIKYRSAKSLNKIRQNLQMSLPVHKNFIPKSLKYATPRKNNHEAYIGCANGVSLLNLITLSVNPIMFFDEATEKIYKNYSEYRDTLCLKRLNKYHV